VVRTLPAPFLHLEISSGLVYNHDTTNTIRQQEENRGNEEKREIKKNISGIRNISGKIRGKWNKTKGKTKEEKRNKIEENKLQEKSTEEKR
jgi:hypothetical protein